MSNPQISPQPSTATAAQICNAVALPYLNAISREEAAARKLLEELLAQEAAEEAAQEVAARAAANQERVRQNPIQNR